MKQYHTPFSLQILEANPVITFKSEKSPALYHPLTFSISSFLFIWNASKFSEDIFIKFWRDHHKFLCLCPNVLQNSKFGINSKFTKRLSFESICRKKCLTFLFGFFSLWKYFSNWKKDKIIRSDKASELKLKQPYTCQI